MVRSLVVLPSLRVMAQADGTFVLTRKFVDGMRQYVDRWPGKITAIFQPTSKCSNNLDNETYSPRQLPFAIEVMSHRDPRLVDWLRSAAVVLSSADCHQNHIPLVCRQLGVPSVVTTELTLKTRCQIARASVRNPLRRWRRYLWEWNQERANRRSIAAATGVQCNGVPTYEAYRTINQRALLYFDTRTTHDMLATDEQLQRRAAWLRDGRPLRLLFSGRLTAIKGVEHLPRLATELVQRGVPFEMQICGGGELSAALAKEIEARGLNEWVKLLGALDFQTELLPRGQEATDLFVCPHRQGDPSCTYLETLACGVPIVGYDNEAWAGLLRHANVGWQSPMDDWRGMAATIARLHADREQVVEASKRALAFASQHTFEQVFQSRINHLLAYAKRCADMHEGEVTTVRADELVKV